MTTPVRLRLSRRKGFNLQQHSIEINGLPAIKVTRPGLWGNPYKVGEIIKAGCFDPEVLSLEDCVALYRSAIWGQPVLIPDAIKWLARWKKKKDTELPAECIHELAGHNLACFCVLGRPCHADVLLELANGGNPM